MVGETEFCLLCHTYDGHDVNCLLSEDYTAIVRAEKHKADGGNEQDAKAIVGGIVKCGRFVHAQDGRRGILACEQEDDHDGPCMFTEFVPY